MSDEDKKPEKEAKPTRDPKAKGGRIGIAFTQDIHRRRRTSEELVTVPADDAPEGEEQAEE